MRGFCGQVAKRAEKAAATPLRPKSSPKVTTEFTKDTKGKATVNTGVPAIFDTTVSKGVRGHPSVFSVSLWWFRRFPDLLSDDLG